MQLDALADCDHIYQDVISGSVKDRPELDKLLARLEPGDTVTVWALDRLFRSLSHAVRQIEEWGQQGITFKSLSQPIDTTDENPASELLRNILFSFAQFERSMNQARTQEGIKAAKARGTHCGRPSKMTAAKLATAQREIANGVPLKQVAMTIGVSRPTLYRAIKRAEAA